MTAQPTIIFDLDGTLADTILDLVPALNRTIAKRNLLAVNVDQVKHLGAKGARAMIERACALNNHPLEHEFLDELFDLFIEDYSQNLANHTVLYDGALACLQRFNSEGWRLGVCTNKHVLLADKLLQELGIRTMFKSVTGGDSFDFRKPDPNHLMRTIELAGGRHSKAIMVGDSQTDILTAQNAKIPVVAVNFGYSELPVASFKPDRVISSFNDLFEVASNLMQSDQTLS